MIGDDSLDSIRDPKSTVGNRITRLAPSPTGALHLGNARTFLATWLLARQNGWKIVLRIEDLDGPRNKRGAAEQTIDDLRWLGIDWDQGPLLQSSQRQAHRTAIDRLLQAKRAYFCSCTRREVELAASAPHADDGSSVYPGTCRRRFVTASPEVPAAARFAVEPGLVSWIDGFAGPQTCDVAGELGDFVIAKADGTAAYQLAVVVDDLAAGVTDVIRGDDLLDSTPRQILLYQALGHGNEIPRYVHLPLVVGHDGRRLAKRHGDTRLGFFREQGVKPSQVLSLLARWLGIAMKAPPPNAAALLGRFDLSAVPRSPIICDATAGRELTRR